MKRFYLIQINDLRYQVDHITSNNIILIEDYSAAATTAGLFVVLTKHRQKIYSVEHKTTQVKDI